MWPIEGIRRRAVRNAISLLEAGGYVVCVEPDHIRLYTRRRGRTWDCYTAAEFFEASAFHAWEAFSQTDEQHQTDMALPEAHGVEVPASAAMVGAIAGCKDSHPWTTRLFRDSALRLAIKRFYEKGYRLDIGSGTVGYLDHNGAYHECLSRSELLTAAERCGREAVTSKVRPIETAKVIPFATTSERDDRSVRGHRNLQGARLSQYERLKRLVLEEFDPRRSKAVGIEQVLRTELFRTLAPRIQEIDEGVDTDEDQHPARGRPTA